MIQTFDLLPGITLRCFPDSRFKQGCLSVQLVRPLDRKEAAMNALIPAVLLRGTVTAPDLRHITLRLDDLYGASMGALVRRVGDYQTTGLYCSFISDRYTLDGEALFQPVVQFLKEVLFQPVTESGVFRKDFVESEKKNLIATIQAQRNNKRAYAAGQLLKTMCTNDPFGVPRLGEAEDVAPITPEALYSHYQKILSQSRIELFYVGQQDCHQVAETLRDLFRDLARDYRSLADQTPFRVGDPSDRTEQMEVAQGKLAMGFYTPITIRHQAFAAMQLCNTILGAGMTSKLFMNIREKMSLCYDIGSGYHGSKGIVFVAAGIDFDKDTLVREKILEQLDACRKAEITPQELSAAKEALITSLEGTHDSPGAIESYYATGALSGLQMTPQDYIQKLRSITVDQVAEAASTLKLHTVYFLKGVS